MKTRFILLKRDHSSSFSTKIIFGNLINQNVLCSPNFVVVCFMFYVLCFKFPFLCVDIGTLTEKKQEFFLSLNCMQTLIEHYDVFVFIFRSSNTVQLYIHRFSYYLRAFTTPRKLFPHLISITKHKFIFRLNMKCY